ncbi:MAG: nucleotidyltransferase domain-containing protein [Candidatus Asgardarchaeia archaeon]
MQLEELLSLLNKNWKDRLNAFVEDLKKHYKKITVILFGSRARGDYSASSDTDILIILDDYDWNDLRLILDIAYRCGVVSPEPHVFSFDYVIRNFESNTLLLDAIYEGIVLIDYFNVIELLESRLKKVLRKFKKTKKGWELREGSKSSKIDDFK